MDDPGAAMSDLHDQFHQRIEEHQATMTSLRTSGALDAAVTAADAVSDAVRAGGKLILFGNGGSAADAMHLAAEFLGRFLLERRPLPALALADNHSAVTAIGNDYAYEQVFSRQVLALGRPGDVAVGLSTSGGSANVAAALRAARDHGLLTIAFTGADGGIVADAADIVIAIPSRQTPRIQEAHLMLGHLICEAVEQAIVADETATPASAATGPASVTLAA